MNEKVKVFCFAWKTWWHTDGPLNGPELQKWDEADLLERELDDVDEVTGCSPSAREWLDEHFEEIPTWPA